MNDSYEERLARAKIFGFGEGTTIYSSSLVIGSTKIGENVWIGPFTVLDGSGGLEIGDNCSISAGVQIYTHDTIKKRLSGGKFGPERGSTKIGHSCYVGPFVIIQKNVNIGNFVIIGAHSLVRTNIPNNSFAYGIPAAIRGDALRKIYE